MGSETEVTDRIELALNCLGGIPEIESGCAGGREWIVGQGHPQLCEVDEAIAEAYDALSEAYDALTEDN